MESFNLLFVLPDAKNERILTHNIEDEYILPQYHELVHENIAFDEPQMYNDFFRKITGISVFRRYSFNTSHHIVFVFEQADKVSTVPENVFVWLPYDEFANVSRDDEIKKIAHSVSLYYNVSSNMPWVNTDGFSTYFAWLRGSFEKSGVHITGVIMQLKNTYGSTVFCVPTNVGNLYMKIPGRIYIYPNFPLHMA